ncbi:MAG: 2OG-Fe(II) oxygenase [Proteobacteria bacterium]|nr:2OG-Fe(II) oxygenase [Pseudomonadota bacterium]
MTQFIKIYENALDSSFCKNCIEKFNKSKNQHQGKTGNGVDIVKKNSIDITVTNFADEWQKEMMYIQNAVLKGLLSYVREFPFLLAGAISIMFKDKLGKMQTLSYKDIEDMDDATLTKYIQAIYRLGSVNMQKYLQGQGGYFHWHSEIYPHPVDPHQDSLHRTVLWMFYLNDVEQGGETEFYYQNFKSQPKQGTLVIAPAGFTHTHRGNTPISGDKYIFTSWILFQTAQNMYSKP